MTWFSLLFASCKRSKRHKTPDEEDISRIKIYSYKELRHVTNGFSIENKIGEGGFGSVYKGRLKDGNLAAIKVLSSDSRQGAKEFLNEVIVISDIAHENLITLLGCCAEKTHRILVYNYLENNSLAQTLLGRNPKGIQFSWSTRVKICVGVARGLAHLHEEVRPRVVHRDIKASNILLDKDLNPIISDFGLAKLLPPNSTYVSTRVAGTVGYLAPECALQGQVTRKSDVYSFGVLLLEIVSGRSSINMRLPSEYRYLLDRTWFLYEHGELEEIIDSSLSSDLDVEEARSFLKIALLCTQGASKRRPSMSSVVEMLTGETAIDENRITKPGLISDFMTLDRNRSQKKLPEASTTSVSSASMEIEPLSSDTSTPFMTFTAITERD